MMAGPGEQASWPTGRESIVLVGFGVESILAGLTPPLPENSVLLVEEPEVARQRGLHELAATMPMVSRLVECPYQLAGALPDVLSGGDLRPVAAVVPAMEYAVQAAADAAARLGLPGAGHQAAAAFRDKHLLRQVAHQAGLRNPRHALVTSPAQTKEFLAQTGGRCVLKPTARQGSLGVQFVESAADIDASWAAASHPVGGVAIPARGIPSQVLIEEAVTGPEFSVELLIADRVACFANVTAKHVFAGRFPVEQGHDVPAPLPAGDTKLLVDVTATLAKAAGMGDGILHAEWILHDGEPVLVECAARLPGGRITRLISLAYDFPLINAYLDVLLGRTPATPLAATGGAAVRYLTAPPGTLTAVTGTDEAAAMPGVTDVRLLAQPGDEVKPLTLAGSRLGFVIAQADTPTQAAHRANAALAHIHLTTKPSPTA
jgi:biotin carboxylase